MDLDDRAAVSWRGADSTSWPGRAGRRRATIALLAAGCSSARSCSPTSASWTRWGR
ncbi:hypothetical protein ACFSNO_33330 [Streptomyces cirratus]